MTPEAETALVARVDAQDARIAMLESHGLRHHQEIKQALRDAAKAIRTSMAAVELLQVAVERMEDDEPEPEETTA